MNIRNWVNSVRYSWEPIVIRQTKKLKRERQGCRMQGALSSMTVSSPILDAGGTLISDKQCKLRRWQEHLLNRSPATPSAELLQAATVAVDDPDISSSVPMEDEVKSAPTKLKNCKARGCCNIAPEKLKASGPAMVTWLTSLFRSCWVNGTIPEDWQKELSWHSIKEREAGETAKTTVAIHCFHSPRIRFAHELLKRIKGRLIATRRNEHSGFTPHRSTIDRMCALNLILQGRTEFQQPPWIAYV